MKELSQEAVYARRHTNAAGKVIPMHHALATLRYPWSLLIVSIVIAGLADVLLWWFMPQILTFWNSLFTYWSPLLSAQGTTGQATISFFGSTAQLPFPVMSAGLPSGWAVGLNLIITSVLFLITLFMPKRVLPLAYFLRVLMFIQASASVFFLFSPHAFPYTLDGYMVTELGLGVYLLFLIAPLLALLYYPMDFPLGSKILLTFIVIVYYIVMIPFQFLLHAWIISSWTYLFLPALYLLFGVLLDVLMFISLYSWGLTWKTTTPRP